MAVPLTVRVPGLLGVLLNLLFCSLCRSKVGVLYAALKRGKKVQQAKRWAVHTQVLCAYIILILSIVPAKALMGSPPPDVCMSMDGAGWVLAGSRVADMAPTSRNAPKRSFGVFLRKMRNWFAYERDSIRNGLICVMGSPPPEVCMSMGIHTT